MINLNYNKLTEQEKKLIDKFYQSMNFGTDSKNVFIEKIENNKIYYNFMGYNYIFENGTDKSITANNQTAKAENFDKIKIVVNQDNIKDYDTLNTITEKELKTKYNDLKIVSNHFLENIFIINNKKYKISKNSNFKIIELEETTENF